MDPPAKEHGMSDDELHTGPDDEQGRTRDEGGASDPGTEDGTAFKDDEEKDGTDLTRVDGVPDDRADPFIKLERVRIRWSINLGRFVNKFTLEASSPSQGLVSPATSVAVVTLSIGATAAVLLAAGAPTWLTLVLSLLPGAAFGIVFRLGSRRKPAHGSDAERALGRRRGNGWQSGGDDASGAHDSGATR
jgi:hypothetical protein